jgi:predicted ABC-type ATPase
MLTLTVVAGANGCGKTTLTRWARDEFQESSVLDPDAIARSQQATGVHTGSAIDAGREALRMAGSLLASNQSFTVETTLSGHTYIRMMREAKRRGYLVVLIYIGTSHIAINMQRIRHRVAKGGHDVPEEDQRRRYPRSLANATIALAIADEAIILDNSADGYIKLAVKRNSGIEIFEPLPRWASFVLTKNFPEKFKGMTVNERLFTAGLLADWDAAVRSTNRSCMTALLTEIGLEDQATQIVDSVLTGRGW